MVLAMMFTLDTWTPRLLRQCVQVVGAGMFFLGVAILVWTPMEPDMLDPKTTWNPLMTSVLFGKDLVLKGFNRPKIKGHSQVPGIYRWFFPQKKSSFLELNGPWKKKTKKNPSKQKGRWNIRRITPWSWGCQPLDVSGCFVSCGPG